MPAPFTAPALQFTWWGASLVVCEAALAHSFPPCSQGSPVPPPPSLLRPVYPGSLPHFHSPTPRPAPGE